MLHAEGSKQTSEAQWKKMPSMDAGTEMRDAAADLEARIVVYLAKEDISEASWMEAGLVQNILHAE